MNNLQFAYLHLPTFLTTSVVGRRRRLTLDHRRAGQLRADDGLVPRASRRAGRLEPIRDVVATLVARMCGTLRHRIDVGYLPLSRGVPTLSGGESQRVKMARQLACDLVDLVYILDDPTVELHPRDIEHLIVMLHRLRDHGSSLLVVEHAPRRSSALRTGLSTSATPALAANWSSAAVSTTCCARSPRHRGPSRARSPRRAAAAPGRCYATSRRRAPAPGCR